MHDPFTLSQDYMDDDAQPPSSEPSTDRLLKHITTCISVGLIFCVALMVGTWYFTNQDAANKKLKKASNPVWWAIWASGRSEKDVRRVINAANSQTRRNNAELRNVQDYVNSQIN